jgi:hypothetical protein
MIEPYDEGIAAARAGEGRFSNPYDADYDRDAHDDWDDGWWSVTAFSEEPEG